MNTGLGKAIALGKALAIVSLIAGFVFLIVALIATFWGLVSHRFWNGVIILLSPLSSYFFFTAYRWLWYGPYHSWRLSMKLPCSKQTLEGENRMRF